MNCQDFKSDNEVFSEIMNQAFEAFDKLDKRGRRKLFAKLNEEFRPGKSNSMYKAYFRDWTIRVVNLPIEQRTFTVFAMLKCIEEVYIDIQIETESQIVVVKRKLEELTELLPVLKNRISAMQVFENIKN